MNKQIHILLAILTSSFVCCPLSARELTDTELAGQVKQILTTHCYRCHGKDGANEGGFNYSLDRTRLVARRKIAPGDSARSKIYRLITDTKYPMPPAGEKPRLSTKQIALIAKWIDRGAPDFNASVAQRKSISPKEMTQHIHSDLETIEPRNRRFTRYFSLAHLYNAGLTEDELQSYRLELFKLINSLSWGRQVIVPKAIDSSQTLFRIDLRDYQWDEKTWEAILEANPYGIAYDTDVARACAGKTGTRLPVVRADWFVASASRPPLYHQILELPTTEQKLEQLLRVDVAKNLQQERVVRAGFNGSGVSRNNRMIERHESGHGAYWKSYDFAGNAERKNLFAHPLGPRGKDAFEHDGGEIIFNLPNGLQAYMLADGQGRRIDKGPTAIVSDPKRPDRAVENGLSCMSCHARGILPKQDQVREHVLRNPGAFSKEDAARILALYAPQEKLNKLYAEDSERFQRAVALTGAPLSITEPVHTLASRFEAEMDLPLVAAELGVESNRLLQALDGSPLLAKRMGALKVDGGTLQRQVFVTLFRELVQALSLGTFLENKTLALARLIGQAQILCDEGQPAKAVAVCSEALKRDPESVLAYLERASAYHDLNQLHLAIADYQRAIVLSPGHAIAHNNRGLAFLDQGQLRRAIQDFDTAVRLDPGYAVAFRNRGRACQKQGQTRQAIADYTRAIEADSEYVSAYLSRGGVYYRRRDYTEAIVDFSKALELDPGNTVAQNNRGLAHLARAEFAEAIRDFNTVIKRRPKHPLGYFNRGLSSFSQDDNRPAIQDFTRAIRFDPKFAKAYWMRSRAHRSEGNIAQAEADLARARRLDPELIP